MTSATTPIVEGSAISSLPQSDQPLLSVVIPCLNEQENLPVLHRRLLTVLRRTSWEAVIVDDHSTDDTFAIASSLADADPRVKALRLARNVGSHLAVICGIEHAAGDAILVIAADLQDPPELIPEMLQRWREGSQIVWAIREKRLSVSRLSRLSSQLFNSIMASIIRTAEIDSNGVDFFLIDRIVADALLSHRETNINVVALLQWMGFRQNKTYYTKEARSHGQSSWSLDKKLKLFVDSVVSFSFLPIRLMSLLGTLFAMAGFIYALMVIVNYFIGDVPTGWSSMIVFVLTIGGVQMLMLGILGEYLWRNLAETRRRPQYLLEDKVGFGDGVSDNCHMSKAHRERSTAICESDATANSNVPVEQPDKTSVPDSN